MAPRLEAAPRDAGASRDVRPGARPRWRPNGAPSALCAAAGRARAGARRHARPTARTCATSTRRCRVVVACGMRVWAPFGRSSSVSANCSMASRDADIRPLPPASTVIRWPDRDQEPLGALETAGARHDAGRVRDPLCGLPRCVCGSLCRAVPTPAGNRGPDARRGRTPVPRASRPVLCDVSQRTAEDGRRDARCGRPQPRRSAPRTVREGRPQAPQRADAAAGPAAPRDLGGVDLRVRPRGGSSTASAPPLPIRAASRRIGSTGPSTSTPSATCWRSKSTVRRCSRATWRDSASTTTPTCWQ